MNCKDGCIYYQSRKEQHFSINKILTFTVYYCGYMEGSLKEIPLDRVACRNFTRGKKRCEDTK